MTNQHKTQAEEILTLLKEKMNLSAYDINVEIKDGQVTLSGVVDVLAEKSLASEVINRLPWVKKVDNSITIAMENGVSDQQMNLKVINKFQELGIDPHSIGTHIADGVVTLQGTITTAAEGLNAVSAAEKVQGVKEVVSRLRLSDEATKDDATVTNAVETALSRSTLLSVRDVVTESKNGVVYLSGWVDNQPQIDEAVRIASEITGVKEVRSHLKASGAATDDDTALTNQARHVLSEAGLGMVKVFVAGGIAFLGGVVQSVDQKYKAGEVMHRVKELTGVHNAITVALH